MTRKYLDRALGIVILLAALYFIVEGVASVYHWKNQNTSMLYKAWRNMFAVKAEFPDVITDERQLAQLVPAMKQAGVALGNAPFPELKTSKASTLTDEGGCQVLRPNIQKTAFFLRSGLYEPLDPITAFYDRQAVLSPELTQFFKRYGFGFHNMSTNSLGERLTVPHVERDRKVMIAGDSMAFGAMIDDSLTLASSLQKLDDARQYVTVSVPGAGSSDIMCSLDRAGTRYRGQLDELIYFYSEDDLSDDTGTVAHLKNFAEQQGVKKVTIIYAPFLYNVVPQFTRYSGYRSERIPVRSEEKAKLKASIEAAGLGWLDIGEIAVADSSHFGTQFAALASFVDHGHLSVHGMNNLVEAYRSLWKSAAVQ